MNAFFVKSISSKIKAEIIPNKIKKHFPIHNKIYFFTDIRNWGVWLF